MKPIYRDHAATTPADRRVVTAIAQQQMVGRLRAMSPHLEENKKRID
jgi:hypothetical protein